MKRTLLLLVFAFAGASIGARLGDLLDMVFTGLETVKMVGMLFGAWAGAMISGGGLAHCYRQIQRAKLGRNKALATVALCVTGAAAAVPSLTDSSKLPPGFMLGVVFVLYRFARADNHRFAFTALLLGTFVGAAISVAGGFEPIAQAIQVAQEHGVQHFIDSAHSGRFHHRYYGRDREELLLASVLIGVALGAAVCLMASFLTALLSRFWKGFTGMPYEARLKRKSEQKRR